MDKFPLLVVLYGPPASGKTTIAREAEKFGARTLTNHDARDFLSCFLRPGTREFLRILDDINVSLVRQLLKEHSIVFFTFSHSGSLGDVAFLHRLSRSVDPSRCCCRFVYLKCSHDTLFQRIAGAGRDGGKISSPEDLREALRLYEYPEYIPGLKSIAVDTERHSPSEIALFLCSKTLPTLL